MSQRGTIRWRYLGTLAWGMALALGGGVEAALEVQARSTPRAGLVFTDSETPTVRVEVKGAALPATVKYEIKEVDGAWSAAGEMNLTAESMELPVSWPGRGLYQLDLHASAGTEQARQRQWVGIVFTPDQPREDSPWGIFYCPHLWVDGSNPQMTGHLAESVRVLGASWARLNFYWWMYGEVKVESDPRGKPVVSASWGLSEEYVRSLREKGLYIMGEISQGVKPLSSQPEDKSTWNDAGEKWGRVKPADYGLWNQLMEKLATKYQGDIDVWEIWNEPDIWGGYWAGSTEEFAELVKNTSMALKRGNPRAKIAAAGFVDRIDYLDHLLNLGIRDHVDILSAHYLNRKPGQRQKWQRQLTERGWNVPLWDTEEIDALPGVNLAHGVEKSFKFLHVGGDNDTYHHLVRRDMSLLRAGVAFSVGAKLIGSAKCVGRESRVPGYLTAYFDKDGERLCLLQATTIGPQLVEEDALGSVILELTPLEGGQALVTDHLGRTTPLTVTGGRAEVTLNADFKIVHGVRSVKVVTVNPPARRVVVVEAETGTWSKGWYRANGNDYSAGNQLRIDIEAKPDTPFPWAEMEFDVPAAGEYEVIYSGDSLERLARPTEIAGFRWNINGGTWQTVHEPVTGMTLTRPFAKGLYVIGTQRLSRGKHTFRMEVDQPREKWSKYYAATLDAIFLRPVQKTR